MNEARIIVFDLETTDVDTETCQIVQFAAVSLDPRTLQYSEHDTFESFARPTNFDDIPEDNIDFHCRVRDINKDELMKLWREAPDFKDVWMEFVDFVNSQNPSGGFWTRPVAAGYNIRGYDLPIINRFCKQYGPKDGKGRPKLFNNVQFFDVMDMVQFWFENSRIVNNYKLDTVREKMGMSKEGSHDALQDVIDTAELLKKFLNLHRASYKRVRWPWRIK